MNVFFEQSAVMVSGVSRGEKIAIFSVAREYGNYRSRIVRREAIETDADSDGVVRYALDGDVPLRSVWAVVDLATGRLRLAAPEGFAIKEVQFPGNGLRAGTPGQLNRLELQRGFVEVFFARPGVGAWSITAYDGSKVDADGELNGRFSMPIDRMVAIGQSGPTPDHVRGQDIVVVFDTASLEVFAVGGQR